MYTLDADGKRLYTLNKVCAFFLYRKFAVAKMLSLLQVQAGEVTKSAHPARFSPDDKYSSESILAMSTQGGGLANRVVITGHRVTLKKRYGLLLTQISEWKTLRTTERGADWEQRTRRSWDSRDYEG